MLTMTHFWIFMGIHLIIWAPVAYDTFINNK